MKPIGYFCNNSPAIADLIGDFGDRLELMNKAGRHGLRLALAGKVYGFECDIYSSAVPLSDIAEDVLGDPGHESHPELPDVLATLDDITSAEALKLIAFLSQ